MTRCFYDHMMGDITWRRYQLWYFSDIKKGFCALFKLSTDEHSLHNYCNTQIFDLTLSISFLPWTKFRCFLLNLWIDIRVWGEMFSLRSELPKVLKKQVKNTGFWVQKLDAVRSSILDFERVWITTKLKLFHDSKFTFHDSKFMFQDSFQDSF